MASDASGAQLAARLRRSVRAPVDIGRYALQGGLHVITGGLGGLGLQAASLLTHAGATAVVLCSRSGRAARGASAGAHVVPCDASDAMEARFLAMRSGARLVGVLHAAGVLSDRLIRSMDAADIRMVFAPKAHAATKDMFST